MTEQRRTDQRRQREPNRQREDDRSGGSPAGAREQGALGGSAVARDEPEPGWYSLTGAVRDAGGGAQVPPMSTGNHPTSSQGLAGAQGSGGGAERGIAQQPDRRDPSSGTPRGRGR